MACDTPSSQDVFTHQIWNSYLKEYRRYAPDSIQFLKTRSEVKFKVTVTQLYYATLRHPKMHPHTKFGIPTSKNIGDMDRTRKRDGRKVYITFEPIIKLNTQPKTTQISTRFYLLLVHLPHAKSKSDKRRKLSDLLFTP